VTATPARIRPSLRDPATWIASGFGCGFVPGAPGTVGSLVAVPLFVAIQRLHPFAIWTAIALVFAIGTWAASRVIRALGREDPGVIVIDEWVGQWLTLALLDLATRTLGVALPSTWAMLAVGFVLFRICDIAKPWPASWADRQVEGGFGTMLDDAFAGLWAGVLASAALWVAAAV
jgi:phosphatidylglycerophosphatase A